MGRKPIDPPPRMGNRIDASCIRGMGKRDDRFLIILDIDRVLSPEELRSVTADRPPAPPERVAEAFA